MEELFTFMESWLDIVFLHLFLYFLAYIMPETLGITSGLEVAKTSSEKGDVVLVADDKVTSGCVDYI